MKLAGEHPSKSTRELTTLGSHESGVRARRWRYDRWLAVAVLVLAVVVVVPNARSLYLAVAYHGSHEFTELGEAGGRPKPELRIKRFEWLYGHPMVLTRYQCGPCSRGVHDECKRRFELMNLETGGTRYQFHCLCSHH